MFEMRGDDEEERKYSESEIKESEYLKVRPPKRCQERIILTIGDEKGDLKQWDLTYLTLLAEKAQCYRLVKNSFNPKRKQKSDV